MCFVYIYCVLFYIFLSCCTYFCSDLYMTISAYKSAFKIMNVKHRLYKWTYSNIVHLGTPYFRECVNKNMKIFTSVVSIWYVEDSKIDFKNENTAHGNRLLLFYKSKIIEIEKDEYFSDNCKKYSHCSTNSKPNSAYCSSTNSHCVTKNALLWTFCAVFTTFLEIIKNKVSGCLFCPVRQPKNFFFE